MACLPSPPESPITDEIAAFLAQGVSILVGTCDADGNPACMRATGIRLADDRRHATVYLPEATSRHTLTNVRANARVAVYLSYPLDHRSYQLKGPVTAVAPADESARADIERYMEVWSGAVEHIGMPLEVLMTVARWPSVALQFRIDELFLQTPGPGAGALLPGRTP